MPRFLALAAALLLPATAFAADEPLQQWSSKHPDASAALQQWVEKNPAAARKVFEWDRQHPEQTKSFVEWAIDNPNDDATAFHTKRNDWPQFRELLDKQRVALNDLSSWARQHPDDAKALMEHPRSLDWAGNHLYGRRAKARASAAK